MQAGQPAAPQGEKREAKKTLMFVVAAALALVAAWEPWSRRSTTPSENTPAGEKLFSGFTNALDASSLEILEFDENTSEFKPFKVSKVNGVWAIPSHQNYPADAREHLAQAATSLIDVNILGLVSNTSGEHSLYGVTEPNMKLKAGTTGVGTRVTLKNASDKILADLILGKTIKDQPGLRYVRKVGKDAVYKVSLKTDSLSTKFEEWIEKDLLKLNSFDIKQVQLNDYSSETFARGGQLAVAQLQRSKSVLAYDDAKSAWNAIELEETKGKDNKLEPAPLTADEELNTEKLNGLKTALDDLKIVDVERKPKGLSQDLKVTEDFVKDAEAQESLFTRGFIPASNRENKLEIISSEGEVIAGMKDGVEYVLRFGRSTAAEGQSASDEEQKDDKDSASSSRLNRYLFVSARFNESLLPKPELAPPPGETPAEKPADKPAESKPEAKKPDAAKPEVTKPEATKPAEAKPAPNAAKPTTKPEGGDEEEDEADEPAVDAKAADAKADKPAAPAVDAKQDEAAKNDAKKAEDEKLAEVEKENKRKQDEYNEKVDKGKKHVEELNLRFADWYYIISDEIYRKIHLSRADIVKQKEKKDDAKKDEPGKGAGVGDFNELEKGLKK